MKLRRVVVTGIGLVTPLGANVPNTWANLIQSKSGIEVISKFDVTTLPVKIGGCIDITDPISGLRIEDFLDSKEIRRTDLFTQYGIIATVEAIKDSGIVIQSENESERAGVIIGSGIGGLYALEVNAANLYSLQNGKTNPFFIPSTLTNILAGHVSMRHNFKGPNMAITSACASGAHSIGEAAKLIAYGDADVMIAGGAEAAVTPLGVAGFASLKALTAKFNDRPKAASRPWDKNRDGFVIAEGAGIMVLEEYESAKKRGAKLYAEVVGYSSTGDAYHITAPHPDGVGAYNAMKIALHKAGISYNDVGYINAHGTSTPAGDEIELAAIQRIFENSQKIKVSSTKSAIGHTLGAAGGIEAIFSILALRDQVAPPTLNLDNPIDIATINLVPHFAQEIHTNYVMSNSFGFGGTNSTLIFKKI